MDRKKAVTLLIDRHKSLASQYSQMSQHHAHQVKDYEAYLYELNKPGFRTEGWMRFSRASRIEPYVIQAEDRQVGE